MGCSIFIGQFVQTYYRSRATPFSMHLRKHTGDQDIMSTAESYSFFSTESKDEQKQRREIGDEAVWTLSTAKSGNGVNQLRDDNVHTYWQSDGCQPHFINIQFHERVGIDSVDLYLDYKLDESYTPKKIRFFSGTMHHDLEEIHSLELNEPSGWITVPLGELYGKMKQEQMTHRKKVLASLKLLPEPAKVRSTSTLSTAERNDIDHIEAEEIMRTFFLQIEIQSMHQNGRDTHIRQVKVYGPKDVASQRTESSSSSLHFKSKGFTAFNTVR